MLDLGIPHKHTRRTAWFNSDQRMFNTKTMQETYKKRFRMPLNMSKREEANLNYPWGHTIVSTPSRTKDHDAGILSCPSSLATMLLQDMHESKSFY